MNSYSQSDDLSIEVALLRRAQRLMLRALGIAKTTLETVISNDPANLAAKNSVALIKAATATAENTARSVQTVHTEIGQSIGLTQEDHLIFRARTTVAAQAALLKADRRDFADIAYVMRKGAQHVVVGRIDSRCGFGVDMHRHEVY